MRKSLFLLASASLATPAIIAATSNPAGLAAVYSSQIGAADAMRSVAYARLDENRPMSSKPKASDARNALFIFGEAADLTNGKSADKPAFNTGSYGGGFGYDGVFRNGSWGVFAAYRNADSSIHSSGGKVTADLISVAAYASMRLPGPFYIAGGLDLGVGLDDTRRNSTLGAETASSTNVSGGPFVRLGAVLPVFWGVNVNPYVGSGYSFNSLGALNETGTADALSVESSTSHSAYAQVGSQFEFVLGGSVPVCRFGLDASFTRRFLDRKQSIAGTDSAGTAFSFEAPALAANVLTLSPYVAFKPSRSTDIRLAFAYRGGLDNGATDAGVTATLGWHF